MYGAKQLAGIAFGLGLLISLAGSALAEQGKSVQLELKPSRDSGVSGTATLTDVDDGVRVELDMQGLPNGGSSTSTTSTEAGPARMIEPGGPRR